MSLHKFRTSMRTGVHKRTSKLHAHTVPIGRDGCACAVVQTASKLCGRFGVSRWSVGGVGGFPRMRQRRVSQPVRAREGRAAEILIHHAENTLRARAFSRRDWTHADSAGWLRPF
jgi:hypothetical protein